MSDDDTVVQSYILTLAQLVADGVGSCLSLGSWTVIVPPITLVQLLPVSLAGWGCEKWRWS
jgi:hypothetical protein